MKSVVDQKRGWYRFASRLAIILGLFGLVTAGTMAVYGFPSPAIALGVGPWFALAFSWLHFGMHREMMSDAYGLSGFKDNRPFPSEFERPPDCEDGITMADTITGGRGCSFWFGLNGVGLQFGWPLEKRSWFSTSSFTGPRVFLPREHILAIIPDGWWTYRVDHRNPELRASFWISSSVAKRMLMYFPEHAPRQRARTTAVPPAKPTKT